MSKRRYTTYASKLEIAENLNVFDYDGRKEVTITYKESNKIKTIDIREFQLHVLLVRRKLIPIPTDHLSEVEIALADSRFIKEKMSSYHVENRYLSDKNTPLEKIFEEDNKKYIVIYLRSINAKKYKVVVKDENEEIFYTHENGLITYNNFNKTIALFNGDSLKKYT